MDNQGPALLFCHQLLGPLSPAALTHGNSIQGNKAKCISMYLYNIT